MFARTVKTKLNKDDKSPKSTDVTVDFTGVSQEQLEELASATVIINEQSVWRTSGVIPEKCTIKVLEQIGRPRGGGFKVTPESMAARLGKNEVEYRETLKLLGLQEAQIDKMAKQKFQQK